MPGTGVELAREILIFFSWRSYACLREYAHQRANVNLRIATVHLAIRFAFFLTSHSRLLHEPLQNDPMLLVFLLGERNPL